MHARTFHAGGLYSGCWAREAARRYEQYWLPLLAATEDQAARDALVPPLDVAYAWLVHRLSPLTYERDCVALFGKALDPSPQQALAFGDNSHNCRVHKIAWFAQAK